MSKRIDPAYPDYQFDKERLREVLQSILCKVAISGYNDEWDNLGWVRLEHSAKITSMGASSERTEVLWTNYEPPKLERLL